MRESVGDDEGVVLPCRYDAGLPMLSEGERGRASLSQSVGCSVE